MTALPLAARRAVPLLTLVVLAVVAALSFGPVSASVDTASLTGTGVAAFNVVEADGVGSAGRVVAGQGRETPGSWFDSALGCCVATEAPPEARQSLFHYTDESGQAGILDSGELRPSLKSVNPKDARYGNGQYLSDIEPGTKTCAQLSRCFIGQPFQGAKFTHYVEIDVTGLDVVKGRAGVFVVPNEGPLDLTGRVVSWGTN